MRIVMARCSVDYIGRLTAHLPLATRLIMMKNDGSVLIHSDAGGYKPLMWMTPPCTVRIEAAAVEVPVPGGVEVPAACGFEEAPGVWRVVNRTGEELRITVEEIVHDSSHQLGIDPGLVKDGVEAHLQELLAAVPGVLGEGFTLVRREYPTAIGPVDLLCRDAAGACAAVEVKRRAGIDAVEQLTRYLELLNRDPLLSPVAGVLAAQSIAPQARTLALDRRIRCVVLDYDALRATDRNEMTLF